MRSCKMPSGDEMPVFGIGTWRMGESRAGAPRSSRRCKYALELGYPMIDTAEMYGDGVAEEIVGEALAGARTAVHRQQGLSAQCHPERHDRRLRAQPEAHEASSASISICCTGAAARGSRETFEAFHRLREAGKIADFGVSNFDTGDMEDAARSTRA